MSELDFSIIKNEEDLQSGKMDGLIHSAELTNQEEVDQAYNSFIFDNWQNLNAQIYTEFPKIGQKLTAKIKQDFITSVIDTDKFQEKNILITSQMWCQLMQTPKQILNMGMFHRCAVTKDGNEKSDIKAYNFSFLSRGKIDDSKSMGYFLTTISFEIPNKKTILSASIAKNEILAFEDLLKNGDAASLEQIYRLANKVSDFSIHHYYLPYGLEQGCISSAILLTRYDHCFASHKNDVLPRLYEIVYKKYTREPHFHFNASFGNIYKLNNRHETYNNGVGYAVGVSTLIKYLFDLGFSRRGDIIAENSLGMPFLNIRKRSEEDFEKIEYNMNRLAKAIKAKDKEKEIRLALDVMLRFTCTNNNTLEKTNAKENREEHTRGL